MPSGRTAVAARFSYESKRVRILTYLSDAMIVFSCVGFAVYVGRHWSWGPFALGPLAAAIGLFLYVWLYRILLNTLPQAPELAAREAERRRWQSAVVVPQYLSLGLACGVIAGSIPAYWPDIVFIALAAGLGFLLPLAFLSLAKRRAEAKRSQDTYKTEAGNQGG
jgi:hypothetical protein